MINLILSMIIKLGSMGRGRGKRGLCRMCIVGSFLVGTRANLGFRHKYMIIGQVAMMARIKKQITSTNKTKIISATINKYKQSTYKIKYKYDKNRSKCK